MDKQEKSDLAFYRLQRAKEDLETAKLLFDNGKYRDCNNRIYYTIFHAIRAILALEEVDFKRHKDVIAYFNKNYIKTNLFPKDLGRKIHISSDIREDSDYEDFYIASKDITSHQIDTAIELLSLAENYITTHK